MRIHRFFEELLPQPGEEFELSSDNAHIARDVLRLREGSQVVILNGTGEILHAELLRLARGSVLVRGTEIASAAPVSPKILLIQGLPKGEKSKWVVQKGVELGVSELFFVDSGHAVSRGSEAATGRWRRTAIEALRQSGNPFLPRIEGPCALKDVLQDLSSATRWVCDLDDNTRAVRDLLKNPLGSSVSLAVGPEGGWSENDRRLLADAGFVSVSLGPYVLRTETAAIAAIAVIRAMGTGST